GGMTVIARAAEPASLRADNFPAGTPLNAFFAWNEARWRRDRRYTIACDLFSLYRRFGGDEEGIPICVSHIAIQPVIRWRFRSHILLSAVGLAARRKMWPGPLDAAVIAAAHRLVASLLASIGSAEPDIHAAVFDSFEGLSRFVGLGAPAKPRARRL